MTSSWNEVHDLISKYEIRSQPVFTIFPGDFLCKTQVYGIFERLGPDQHIDESHFKAKGGAFFFKKPDHVADFIEQFSGKNIEKISCPVNSYHESLLMEKDKSVEIRQCLYSGKYRYVVVFPLSMEFRESQIYRLDQFLGERDEKTWSSNSLQELMPGRNGLNPIRIQNPNQFPVFLQNEEDFVQLKLLYEMDGIRYITVILLDEILKCG